MTIIVRTITQRAGGGDITRQTPVDGDEVLIGRGTDCPLQVPDLGVMLNHARLRRTGDRIVIEAVAGVDIELGGKFGPRFEIDAGKPATIRMGGHTIAVGTEPDGTTILTLERVAAISDAGDAEDEVRIFTLAGGTFGRRRMAWAGVIVILALFLIWPVAAFMAAPPRAPLAADAQTASAKLAKLEEVSAGPDISWSSGPLSKAHAGLANDCGACHQAAFTSIRDDSCIACHSKVADHAKPDRLQGAMFSAGVGGLVKRTSAHAFNLPEGRCASCHSEHEGVNPPPATDAGQCIDCHRDLKAKLPDTVLADATDFAANHPQFRPAVVTQPAFGTPQTMRVSLDGKVKENSGLIFPHDLHLSKTNGVARMAISLGKGAGYGSAMDCADCHRPDGGNVRFMPIEMERDCGTCHSLVFDRDGGTQRTLRHGEPKQVVADLRDFYRLQGPIAENPARRIPGEGFAIQSVARRSQAKLAFGSSVADRIRSVFQPGGACADCHTILPPAVPGSLDYRIAPVSLTDRYMSHGWFSHADHDTADMPCASCHVAKSSKVSSDLLIPGIANCRECHVGAEPKKGKITSDCAACHVYHDGSPLPSQKKGSRVAAIDWQKRKLS